MDHSTCAKSTGYFFNVNWSCSACSTKDLEDQIVSPSVSSLQETGLAVCHDVFES